MAMAKSAAAQFASIEELLLILANYVNDPGTLWSLCLSNWRFNCIFTPKLFEHLIIRAEAGDDGASVPDTVGKFLAGRNCQGLRHLELIMKNGPQFPGAVVDAINEVLVNTPNLKIFTWDSYNGEVPSLVLRHLSKYCPLLEELHLRGRLEEYHYHYEFRNVHDQNHFKNVRVFTCKSIESMYAMSMLNVCPNVELVQMSHMEHMLSLGWVHAGYHGHLKALIVREELMRARSGRPLKMFMCHSRISRMVFDCEVCNSPGMNSHNIYSDKYSEVWPWAAGKAQQYLVSGQVRHITYEYPHPEPSEMEVHPAYNEL